MGCGPSGPCNAGLPDGNPQKAAVDVRVARGQMYLQQGLLDQAMEELDAVIEMWPSTARAHYERGNVNVQRQQWDAAITDFTTAIKCQNHYMMAYVLRAQAYLRLQNFDDALADCAEAARMGADDAQVTALTQEVHKARECLSSGGADSDAPGGGLESMADSHPGTLKLCMVCMTNEPGCRLLPCLHAALCLDCAKDLQCRGFGCPTCNTAVADVEIGRFLNPFSPDETPGCAIRRCRDGG